MKLYLKQTTILMGMCSALGMYAPEVQASNGEANSLIATSVTTQHPYRKLLVNKA